MTDQTANLIKAATAVLPRAHAPYSRFHVAAAILARSGRVHLGVNVENVSFGLTICAERSALVQAVVAGDLELVEAVVVVAGSTRLTAPCGMCRQSFVEFCADLPITLANEAGESTALRLADLLPMPFRPGAFPTG